MGPPGYTIENLECAEQVLSERSCTNPITREDLCDALGIEEHRLWGLAHLLMATGFPLCFGPKRGGYRTTPIDAGAADPAKTTTDGLERRTLMTAADSSVDEDGQPGPATVEGDHAESQVELPGVVAILGALGPGAVVTEEGVARMFNRHQASVKRAVERGELPPPTRLFGQNTWTAGVLVRHIEARLQKAADKAERWQRKVKQLSP